MEFVEFTVFETDNPNWNVALLLRRIRPYDLRDEIRRCIKSDETIEVYVPSFFYANILEAYGC